MERMMTKSKSSMHEEVFWRTRLNVAFRTAFGCFLTGLMLQLGSMHVELFTFPIFAYVMAVTVVGESTFGKAFQDTAGVLIGTIQSCGISMIVFQIFGTEKITLDAAILCISLSSFAIVYPKNIPLLSKRVALAHTAILYVTASIERGTMQKVSFPLKLAGTTMAGAISGMLALLLPFPHLAMFQVRSQLKLSTRIISERLRTMVDAFCVNDIVKGLSLSLQAESLAKIASSVDAEIVSKTSDLGWEFPIPSGNLKHLIKGLKKLKYHLVGMESALTIDLSSHSNRMLHQMLKDCLIYLTDWACLAMMHASENRSKSATHMQLIIDEGKEALADFNEKLSSSKQKLICKSVNHTSHVGLETDLRKGFQFTSAALFFLFSLESFLVDTADVMLTADKVRLMLNGKLEDSPRGRYPRLCDLVQIHIPSVPRHSMMDNLKPCKYCCTTQGSSFQLPQQRSRTLWFSLKSWLATSIDFQQFRTAFKMSLAMAMGAFFGSWFSKTKGYWADITLGLGYAGVSKGGSFKSATLRAQGTVAGSIYGLLVVLATKRVPVLRMFALVPWAVLTSFLRHSKIYGYAGAVSAFTGAIVILARTQKDSTDEDFTVIRIVEAFLGMTSFIVVELLVMPSRATSLVKIELVSGLSKIRSHITAVLSVFKDPRCEKCCATAIVDLKAKEKVLKSLCARLKALVKEAAEEPRFWFSAFPEYAYSKIVDALSRTMDHLHFSVSAFEEILKVFEHADLPLIELHDAFGAVVHGIEERLIPLMEFLEHAYQGNLMKGENIEGLKMDGADRKHNAEETDHTSGIVHYSFPIMDSILKDLFMEQLEKAFHQLSGQLVCRCSDESRKIYVDAFSNTFLLSLGALAFSMEGLLQEASNLDKAFHELLQLESPWTLIDIWDSSGYFRFRHKL